MSKTAIIIAGPTASGKTALAISVAKALGTEILSADSRQCYKEMNIGVARPSADELAAVPHHFIASHSITDELNAAAYERIALDTAEKVFSKADHLVVTGGTGLYLKAFTDGLDDIPPIPEQVQHEVRSLFVEEGLPVLIEKLREEDPDYFSSGEIQNPHRVMRALEVVRATGRSIRSFQRSQPRERHFSIRKFAIDLPREILYERINQRVDAMMQAGLEEEVRQLFPFKHLNALQTVGYRELFAYFEGEYKLAKAVEMIKQNTRHYAKRQLTWFRRDASIQWLTPANFAALPELIKG